MESTAPSRSGAQGRSLRAGIWRLADPKVTLASVASMVLGAAAAARDGRLAWGWLALTVLGVFFVEVAKNASGEVFDFDSGADAAVAPEDRSPFSGGKRVLVDGLLTRAQTSAVAAGSYALAAGAGLGIVLAREPRVLRGAAAAPAPGGDAAHRTGPGTDAAVLPPLFDRRRPGSSRLLSGTPPAAGGSVPCVLARVSGRPQS